MLLRHRHTFAISMVIHLCLFQSLKSENRWKRSKHFRQPAGNWIFFLVRSYPNSETNDYHLGTVFLIASYLQCVGIHYHIGELACLCLLISAGYLPDSSSCCPVSYSRSLLWSIDQVLWSYNELNCVCSTKQ